MPTRPPVDTPAWFLHYFEKLAVTFPTSEKLLAGKRAAALWVAYHDNADRATTASHTLVTVITILSPYRRSGSGLFGLWQQIIQHLTTLPVPTQCDMWQAIFEIADHCQHPIPYSREAQAVIVYWRNYTNAREKSPAMIEAFMALIVPYFFDSVAYEWLALIDAIDKWMGGMEDMPRQTTLFDMIVTAHTRIPRKCNPSQ